MTALQIFGSLTGELNRLHDLFVAKHPQFRGATSIFAHSLGSLLAFDLLCHQGPGSRDPAHSGIIKNPFVLAHEALETGLESGLASGRNDGTEGESTRERSKSKEEFKLHFRVRQLFCFGSPLGLFVLVRGLRVLGCDGRSSTQRLLRHNKKKSPGGSVLACQEVYNIFHPHDPIAYRLEPLVLPRYAEAKDLAKPHVINGEEGLSSYVPSSLSNLFGSSIKPADASANAGSASTSGGIANGGNADADVNSIPLQTIYSYDVSLDNFNDLGRVDCTIREAAFANAYVSSLNAHMNYWEDDVMLGFALDRLTASSLQHKQ